MIPDEHRTRPKSAGEPTARLWTHIDYLGEDGTDVLVETWPDGSTTIAAREGRNETWHRWGPPVELRDPTVLERVGGAL